MAAAGQYYMTPMESEAILHVNAAGATNPQLVFDEKYFG